MCILVLTDCESLLSCFQRGKGKGGYYYQYYGYGGKGKGKGKGNSKKRAKSKKGAKGKKGAKVPPVQPATPSPSPVVTNGTIVDYVTGNPDLTSLTEAVIRAGLVEALDSEGPLTLFAPNNDAFAAVSADIAQKLFNETDFIPQLVDLLLLHVIAGSFPAAALTLSPILFGLNGEEVFIDFPPLSVNLNNVVDGDNFVSNGVVHVIDGVLIPSWVPNSLQDRVFAYDDLSTLYRLLVLTDIDLSDPAANPVTVVGPTNDAFDLLDPAVLEFLMTDSDGMIELKGVLLYHVFFGILTSTILLDGFVRTLEGGAVAVTTGPSLMFNLATAVELDILANNGVLYKIDQVLNPADAPIED
jgi:transforming growth factor-beta-induced protein